MPFRHGARVKHTSTTTGTGTLSLIAPATGFVGFNNGYGVGPVVVYYCISGATYFEIGIGSFDNTGPTLTRATVLASSNANSLVSLPAATHDVFAWEPANYPVQAITTNETLTLDELFSFILFTGSSASTLTLPAIASVPIGVGFPVLNLGTAVLTIDPNSTETINGATTIKLFPGEGCWIFYRDTATAQWAAIVSGKRQEVNTQTGTTYTFLLSDNGKEVTFSNTSAVAVTLPQATATTFGDGWSTIAMNLNNGAVTITPTTSTINGAANIVLQKNQGVIISSVGGNYRAERIGVPIEVIIIAVGDDTTTLTTGTAKVTFRMPFAMRLTQIPRASLATVSSSGIPTVDINEAGVSILSTKLTIDANEKTSVTAATAAVLSDSDLADDAEITIDIDVAGTGAKGLKVSLFGVRNVQ